ncbi:MAG: AAA family ATPase [Draconibacterium sp.]|nr:AAA family ATPase [Draconibacterium sp.]
MDLVGRLEEIEIMKEMLSSDESEMLAVIGRRRVGKTFLIREVYKDAICFEITGIKDASKEEQLYNFSIQLAEFSKSEIELAVPNNWIKAFNQLARYLDSLKSKKKKVIFFDELPWLSTRRSGFLEALAHFWNNRASRQNIVVVICGSAASWMIDKVVNNKGGLHNRITRLIQLEPFNLQETEMFFKTKSVKLNHYQIVQIYLTMGGIPHYLKEVKPGLSAAQNIDKICFQKNGLLKNEFQNLYAALFENAQNHEKIIRVLANKGIGLTRNELVKLLKISDGGSLTRYLNELITSGFISKYQPFGKQKKETLYRLTDEYSLFYIRFIERGKNRLFAQIYNHQQWKSWSGFAFESVCMKHVKQIKHALGISGVLTTESSFIKRGTQQNEGFQIDLLIDRNDNSINICEMKFYESEFEIDAEYAKKLRHKIAGFREYSKTRKQLFVTLVSTFGVKQNKHSTGLVDNSITIDWLFKKLV